MIDFGLRIKFLRVNVLGMGRAEFSEKFNIPEITIRSWEGNKAKPSERSISKLIDSLSKRNIKVSMEWLKYGQGIPPTGSNYPKTMLDILYFDSFLSNQSGSIVLELENDQCIPFLPKNVVLGGVLISDFSKLHNDTLVIYTKNNKTHAVKRLFFTETDKKILFPLDNDKSSYALEKKKKKIYKIVWIKYPD